MHSGVCVLQNQFYKHTQKSNHFILEYSCSSTPLNLRLVHILVLWAELFGFPLQSVPSVAHQAPWGHIQPACPKFCSTTETERVKYSDKTSTDSSLYSVDTWMQMYRGWPHSRSRQSITRHGYTSAAPRSTLHQALQPSLEPTPSKLYGNAALHSNEWTIKPCTVRENREENLKKKQEN